MSCIYLENHGDKYQCQLSNGDIDSETLQKYCSAGDSDCEDCPEFVKAEILTAPVCEEIIQAFSEAIHTAAEGFCGFTELVTEGARRYDYLPLHDACRCLETAPQIPSAGNAYSGIVKTPQEQELAQELDSALDELLDSLRISVPYGPGGGECPRVSSSDIANLVNRADYYGSLVPEYLESFSLSVKPDKYNAPAQDLASRAGHAIRDRFRQVVDALQEAQYTLERGIAGTLSSADDIGWTLSDANIHWEVD